MDFNQAVNQFRQLLLNVKPNSKIPFLTWLKENIQDERNGGGNVTAIESPVLVILNAIRDDIRSAVPINAVLPSETLDFPKAGKHADIDPNTTLHVDAFLYDDDIIDDLCDKGMMSRNYCTKCGSHDIRPLTFITHSMSTTQLQYLFKFLLPDLTGKKVLDVGSRTGAVLYSAFLLSNAQQIVGVEMNQDFCQLQSHITEKYNMQDRVKILHSDIMNVPGVLETSDVIVIYNAFEFFLPKSKQESIWRFLSQHMRKRGSLVVTSPSLEESLSHLQTEIDIGTWLKPLPVSSALQAANAWLFGHGEDEDSDLDIADLHLYEIL